ncbi:Glycerophosphoryl diester phosphodiesterase [compost metagenome]
MIERLESNSSIMVAGHRGWKSAYPENTLLSFKQALDLGVDMIEFDLHLSKDGVVVVIHDGTVDRTTNGTGEVRSFTASELKQLDAGHWFGPTFEGLEIPTLEELCELLKDYPEVLLNVEIKSSPDSKKVADQAIAMLKNYDYLPRCVFTSFDASILSYICDTYNLKTQGFPGDKMHNFIEGENGTYSKMWAVGIEMSWLNPEVVQQFKARGILIWSFCPDDDKQVQFSLDCKVTGMTCNDPRPALRLVR